VLGDAAARKGCMEALRSAAGYIRRELSARIRLRVAPELHFVSDDSIARGVHLSQLIDQAIGGRPEHG
jgi:ribosome-binding factor A